MAETKTARFELHCNDCGDVLISNPNNWPQDVPLAIKCAACGSRSFTVNPTEH